MTDKGEQELRLQLDELRTEQTRLREALKQLRDDAVGIVDTATLILASTPTPATIP